MPEESTNRSVGAIFYDQTLFLGRHTEIQSVKEVLALMVGQGQGSHILMFRGSRGLGKTWFSLHLQRIVIPEWKKEQRNDVTNLWIGMDTIPDLAYGEKTSDPGEYRFFSGSSDHAPEASTHKLLYYIAQQIDALHSMDAGYIQIQWILDKLRASDCYLVLVFDSLFELEWKYISELERAVLAPLSELANVLLIITGRGPEYTWSIARFRAQPAAVLKPFEEEYEPHVEQDYIADQLRTQAFTQHTLSDIREQEIIQQIKAQTKGYPLNNLLIAQALITPEQWDLYADELLEPYPKLSDEGKATIKALATLSPDARFREEEIEELGSYVAKKQLSGTDVRRQLYSSNIIHWDRGGWVIEEAVADFFRAQLVFDSNIKERFTALHQRAIAMYDRWQKEEQNPQAYKQEISYHREQLGKEPS